MTRIENLTVGLGFDVHPLVHGRKLILGGIEIPFDRGLDGHSDGDVVLHAVIDAVASAADLPDIGEMFPGDDENLGRSSVDMAQEVARRLSIAGAKVLSVDAIIITQVPRISPYREQIRESIAECFGVDGARVNVKGKTFDHLGPIGREEGIECRVVALVERRPVE